MTLPQHLYKAHATGNDFVLYIDVDGTMEPTEDEVRHICDRHFGIGADGLIRLAHPSAVSDVSEALANACRRAGAEWFMDYRNADGSLAEMCGNGTRAVTLLAQRSGLAPAPGGEPFRLGTRAGVKTLRSLGAMESYGNDVFEVSLGAWKRGEIDGYEVTIPGCEGSARGTFVDMGNPHVVAVVGGLDGECGDGSRRAASTLSDVGQLDLSRKPQVSPSIPSDQNVEFVRIDSCDSAKGEGSATMRVNERGCGETLSCGTGLAATAVVLRAKTGVGEWDIRVRGGLLHVSVSDDEVKLTGAAELVACVELC